MIHNGTMMSGLLSCCFYVPNFRVSFSQRNGITDSLEVQVKPLRHKKIEVQITNVLPQYGRSKSRVNIGIKKG